jgi:hypothetical protein
MKKSILLIAFAIISHSLTAQNFQFGAYVGHQTPASLELYYGKYRTQNGTSYGGTLSFGQGPGGKDIFRNSWVELQYNYKLAPLSYFDYTTGITWNAGELEMHNILIGPIKEADLDRVRPFGGLLLGATILVPEFTPSELKFTASVLGGVKADITDKLGVRLQAQLLMPFYFTDASVVWSPNYGTSAGLSSSAVILSASFNAGIYLNISKDSNN